jgi:serine/threonine protein kinase
VADFGLSIRMPLDKTHMSGISHGTPLYMAPEVVQQQRTSKASDVWSFGVMVWELVHGRTAWRQYLLRCGAVTASLLYLTQMSVSYRSVMLHCHQDAWVRAVLWHRSGGWDRFAGYDHRG